MARTEANLPQHEWFGLEVEVMKEGGDGTPLIRGEVVDETRNTIGVRVAAGGGSKTFPKQGHVFRFILPGKASAVKVDIVGREALFRPEDRVKKMAIKQKKRSKYRR